MKISQDWLSEFVTWKEKDPLVIAETLTRGMGEVERVERRGELLAHCVIGKVVSVEKHPNADKLSLCDVETDRGVKRVVCGGTNLREGMLTAFAHVGATVKWHGGETMTLAPATIRGEKSEGMICAGEELEIESLFPAKKDDGERPIADLSQLAAKTGAPLAEALGMHDVIFHIDNHAITNRPDLFSHVGVARECVALGLAAWKKKPAAPRRKFPAMKPAIKMKIGIPKLVPFYRACTLTIDGPGETPDWMKRRLEATGWRSINLPIDITNYVLMECGMPLHSFDADDIIGTPTIREAKEGETMTTLDGKTHKLPKGALVISDDDGIFDLLGIMGGLRSATKESTRHIYLHGAIMHGPAIRKTVVALGQRTEAATVYEKQVPHVAAEDGMARALELFLELVPGATIASHMEKHGTAAKKKSVRVHTHTMKQVIGADLSAATTKRILSDLGCVVKTSGSALTVSPPAWRNDLREEADIVEEVARMYGYANIAPLMPVASIAPPERDTRIHRMRDALKEEGFTELVHLAFTSPHVLHSCGMDAHVRLANPLGEELSCMRPSLLPQLLTTASAQLRERDDVATFEYGRVFRSEGETLSLAMMIAGHRDEEALILKEHLLHALANAHYEGEVVQRHDELTSAMHPGRTCDVLMRGTKIGTLFALHPIMAASLGLPSHTAACEIDLDVLFGISPHIPLAKPLPNFPAITYDETVELPLQKTAATLIESMKKKHALLESVETVDLFRGEDTRRLTLRFTYRSPEKTLTEEEAMRAHRDIVSLLQP